MKRFLRKVGLLTAAMMMLSGVAYADANGSVAANKWLRIPPTDDGANVLDLSTTSDRLQRNQTLYFTVVDQTVGGDKTVQQTDPVTLVDCTVGHASTGCASAPLFIASSTAMICVDEDMAGATAGGSVVTMYVCEDSSCTRATSVPGVTTISSDRCQEFMGGDATGYDSFNVGGSWVYVDVSTGPGDGETLLIWVTGN